jgi:hypothetical protein
MLDVDGIQQLFLEQNGFLLRNMFAHLTFGINAFDLTIL